MVILCAILIKIKVNVVRVFQIRFVQNSGYEPFIYERVTASVVMPTSAELIKRMTLLELWLDLLMLKILSFALATIIHFSMLTGIIPRGGNRQF